MTSLDVNRTKRMKVSTTDDGSSRGWKWRMYDRADCRERLVCWPHGCLACLVHTLQTWAVAVDRWRLFTTSSKGKICECPDYTAGEKYELTNEISIRRHAISSSCMWKTQTRHPGGDEVNEKREKKKIFLRQQNRRYEAMETRSKSLYEIYDLDIGLLCYGC
jgi:hypothetical protein